MNKNITRMISFTRKQWLCAAFCFGALGSATAQTTETFTSGTASWTVPAGVTSITVECWGGGGGGGAATSNASANVGNQFVAAGGGGKGGMYTNTTFNVTSGTVYSVTVGAGGTAGNTSAGGAGGKSAVTLASVDQAWASGGNGGGYGNNSAGAGATAYSVAGPSGGGVIIFNGGNGASGQRTITRQSGGGGGGAAGTGADGSAATNPISGGGSPTGVSNGGAGGATGGGNGGAGGSGTNNNAATAGTAGSIYGGAGGGARSSTNTSGARSAQGGAGANGFVRITYTVNICTANAGAALAYICETGTSAPLGGSVGAQATAGIWTDGGIGGTFTPSATDLNATWTAPAGFTGNVTLTLTSTNGACPDAGVDSKMITVATAPGAPVFNAATTTLCVGESAVYTATAAGTSATITYSIAAGGANIDATTGAVSNVTSDFTVRATAANNCGSAQTDLAVTVNPNPASPVITADGPTTFCQGSDVVLSSSQTSGNVWSTTDNTQSITVTEGGSYTVTYTDANGCTAISVPTVVTINTATASITAGGATAFCEGGSVILTSSASTGNLWSTGETTGTITVDESDDISVTVIDGNGCSATSAVVSVIVNANPAPVITASGTTDFCEGGNVAITSSETSGNLWSTGENGTTITVQESAAIIVTVTDGNGCTGTSNVITTTENPNITPVITAGGPTAFCEGGNVTITSSETSGNLWSTGEIGNSIVVSSTATITLTNTAACATGPSNEIIVTENPNPAVPVITAGGPVTFCEGGSLTLTSSAAAGNTWSTNATASFITVAQTGNYTVTVTDGNGCSATSATTAVTVNPAPVAIATLTNDVVITATPAGQAYQWINCATGQPVAGASSAIFTVPANGSYKVVVTNASGCKDTSSCVQVSKVGLEDLTADQGIAIYPNPSNGLVTIVNDLGQSMKLAVLDASGKLLFQQEQFSGSVIDLSVYQAGMYFFRIQTTKGTSLHRVILE